MTCDQTRALFSELADAVLTPDAHTAVMGHLAGCPDCRREWEGFQRMLRLLHEMPRARAPRGFVDRVVSATQPSPWPRRLLRGIFVPVRVKLPLEAAALLIVAAGSFYLVQRTPEFRQAAQQQEVAPRFDRSEGPSSVSPAPPPAPASAPEARASATAPAPAAEAPGSATRTVASAPAGRDASESAAEKPEAVEARRQRASAPLSAPEPPARRDQAGQQLVAERLPKLAQPREVPWPGARTSAVATISGHLAVRDPQAAERAFADLLRRVGAVEVRRNTAGNLTNVELELARGAWAEFVNGLGSIGAWAPDAEPADLPQHVVVIVRMGR